MSVQLMGAELGPPACLPANWKTVRFGDVCRVQCGFAFKSADYQKEGVPLVRISNLVNAKVSFDSDTVHLSEAKLSLHREFILETGDTLIAMSGATTGKMATYDLDTPALLNQRVGRFRILSEDSCSPRFISLLVTQITKKVLKEAYGAAQPNISPTQIEQFEIPLPPLDEQLRIAAEIEKQFTRLEAGESALRRVQANLKRYRAAVLKAACQGQLVPTEAELQTSAGKGQKGFESGEELLKRILTERRQRWTGRGKYKEPAAPDLANLPPLPVGWTWAAPNQLCAFDEGAICAGPFGTIFKARDFRPAGVPIIFLRHVAPGRYLTHKPGFMDEAKWNQLFRPYSVFGGELLVTKLGEPPGVCAIYPHGIGPAMVTPDVIKMTPNPEVAHPVFLMHYFNSQTARDFATGVAFGTTRLRLTLPIFRDMPVPLPPIAEQSRIVAEVERRLSVIEELESVILINLQRSTHLRQSILQKAFTGKLTP